MEPSLSAGRASTELPPDQTSCQRFAIAAPIKSYFCPSRGRVRVFTQGTNWYNPSTAGTHAQTDYGASVADDPGGNLGDGFLVKTFTDDGVTRLREPNTFAAITDGLTNTLFAGDKRLPRDRMGGFQGEDNEGYTSGWDHDVHRRTDLLPLPDCNASSTPRCADSVRFGSSHLGGFNGLLGDGSVRFIKFSIDATTFLNLGRINNGQVVSNF